jgi:hypothetical protein
MSQGGAVAHKKEKEKERGTRSESEMARENEAAGSVSRMRIDRPDSALKEEDTQESTPEGRTSRMAVDEMKTERAQQDYKDMAKTWKSGYLTGLETLLHWQAQNERLFKDTVKQGFSGSRQLLTMWKDWMNHQTEEQQRFQERTQSQMGNGGGNPILGLTRQSTEAVVATVEPILKTSEAAMDSTFGYYQSALAAPSRKYVQELNKQVLDAVIPN